VLRYATIVRDLNVVNSGAKPGVLPPDLGFSMPFCFFLPKIRGFKILLRSSNLR